MPTHVLTIETESAAQFIKRVKGRSDYGKLNVPILEDALRNGFCEGDIVEISGDLSTGKRELISKIIVNSVLPTEWNGFKMDGLAKGVVLIDANLKFDLIRMVSILKMTVWRRIRSSHWYGDEKEWDLLLSGITEDSLRRLHVIRPESPEHLILCLYNLSYFFQSEKFFKLLVIDGIGCCYWTDKAEIADSFGESSQRLKQVSRIVKHLVDDYSLLFICTKAQLFNNHSSMKGSDYLIKQWKNMVTHRFFLKRGGSVANDEGRMTSLFSCSAIFCSKEPLNPQAERFFCVTNEGIIPYQPS